MLTSPIIDGANPGIFLDCQLNLEMSIRTRVTQAYVHPPPLSLPTREFAELLVADFRTSCNVNTLEPLDFEEWNSRWTPGKRETMRAARDSPPRWRKMAFTKAEFVKPGDPRNIVCSDPTVLARLGPITSAFDHALKNHPAAIKGYDMLARAKKMSVLRRHTHFMTSDYSRFDKTITSELLKVEKMVYEILCPAVSSEPWVLEALTRMCLPVSASSWRGVMYKAPAMRGTGDANTALGNWLLNRLVFLLMQRSFPEMTVFIEGDDAICGYDYPIEEFEGAFRALTRSLGLVTKCWSSPDLEEVPFCGRHLTATGPPRTVPALWGYLTKWHVSKRTVYNPEEAIALLRFKTMSYLAMEPDTPIVPAIAQYFLRVLPNVNFPTPEYVKVLRDNRGHLWRRKPTLAQRMIVQKVSGLTIATQLDMERYFDSLKTLQTSYPQFIPFVPPDLSKVELCPLPPPKFEQPPCPRRKIRREDGIPAAVQPKRGGIQTPTGPTPTPQPSRRRRQPPGAADPG